MLLSKRQRFRLRDLVVRGQPVQVMRSSPLVSLLLALCHASTATGSRTRNLSSFSLITPRTASRPRSGGISTTTTAAVATATPDADFTLASTLALSRNYRALRVQRARVPKLVCEVPGDLVLGGLMMVHERGEARTCGPIMPQGGVQALETMVYTLDYVNRNTTLLPGMTLGAHILDDCDKDTYGLEQSVDFIKGKRDITSGSMAPIYSAASNVYTGRRVAGRRA